MERKFALIKHQHPSTDVLIAATTAESTVTITDYSYDVGDVRRYGAVGDGTTDCTSAFTAARTATSGRYYVPTGTWLVSSSPDVWADAFTAAGAAYIKIGSTTYDVSNAFCGRLRYRIGSNVKTDIVDAVTGNTIYYMQNSQPGTATGFYRGLAFTTDSHWVQAQPATNGGSTDILWQRSTLNADPGGNRFNETFAESSDSLTFSYATSASGAPSFDSFMQVVAGTSPSLTFPALRGQFQQGWTVQTRAGGALKLSLTPGATSHTLVDDTSTNTIGTITRSYFRLGGIAHNTLLDVPNYSDGPQRWGATYADFQTPSLPVNKTLLTLSGTTKYAVLGTLKVAFTASGGGQSWRESRFTHDGATLTVTDLVNTLPASATATIAMSGSNLQFQGAYTGALGGGHNMCVMIEWCFVGR